MKRYLKIFFPVLCIAEFFYRLGFYVVSHYKRLCNAKGPFSFKVISVGNISIGGTGKSVVVPMLAQELGLEFTAIVLRSYKGSIAKSRQSFVINNGFKIFFDVQATGDEAMVYAQQLGNPVVVGANRAQSCQLLEQLKITHKKNIQYVILDDAYQNHAIKKDCEILLLDARAPFDNGHCLPAGRLREYDYSRADIIILTHANKVDQKNLKYIKEQLLKLFPLNRIFTGAHVSNGIFYLNRKPVPVTKFLHKRFLLVAGVGSFQGVLATIHHAGINILMTREYADHQTYTSSDIAEFMKIVKTNNLDGIITTTKDWAKLSPLLATYGPVIPVSFYVVRVAFEFLSSQEYDSFREVMREKLMN